MKTITLALAAVFLFSACSTLPPEPPLTQEQIQKNKDNLAQGFSYFANKRMYIVDGDSSFDEFEIRPLDDGVSADYIFYKVKKNKEFKYTLTNCRGGGKVEDQYLSCDLRDKYEDRNSGVIFLNVATEDYTWKDGRIIPTHKKVVSKKGDITLRVSIPFTDAFIGYTEFAVVKFKN
jgi:hypothetical protein